ncbi:carbohydrate-binding protein [Cohnella nanjingensis]|uniref:Carbohydrate-binding protein n=2 Tax=Cohnella nanjingensis TaxID=1387779 RepID=A0A7X0RTX2_9BACL|nr:carbohydrate-binding protein [Cohnella nanjingensis]
MVFAAASWSGFGTPAANAAEGATATPAASQIGFSPSDADTAMKAFNQAFWDPNAKFFWSNSNRGTNYQGFWVEAELWELVMDAYLHTSDAGLKATLRNQIDEIFDGTVAKYGADWTDNHFNDDIMWWAMGSARAYEITQEPRYLEKAKYYFDFVYDTQWEDSFANGGIWWMNTDHSTKNACINFPAAEAAVYLYNATKDDHYLEAATRIYRWGKTMLTDGNGKVFDRIEMKNGAVPDATHYNQGTFIGSAVGLYRITGNRVYLDDAVKAAAFTQNHLVDGNGLLRYEGPNGDLKGGKTILVRNLAYLQQALDRSSEDVYKPFATQFKEWLAANTNTAWSNRNADGIVDGNWAGQLLSGTYESWSSAAAVEALTVLQPGSATLPVQARNPYAKVEAESYSVGSGFGLEGSSEGTLQLAGIQAGGFAAYKNVDFGSAGAVGLIARASSATGGGNIEVHLDAANGPKVGTLAVEGTGSWNTYSDAVAVLKDDQGNPSVITGVHDVYLVFAKTNDTYLYNLNWFKFTTSDPTKTDAYARLKAIHAEGSSGLSVNADAGILDGIGNGAYAFYKGIDLGSGAAGITAHVSSGGQGGTIEVRLDGVDGPVAGTIGVPALGDWNNWVDLMANIDDSLANGVHDVYLVFRGAGGSDYPCNLGWFTFTTVKGKARDAYAKLEAENYTGGAGFGTENGGGQTYLAGINAANNPYAMYNYIDFGSTSPTKMHVQAASDTAGGTIEVRIDSLNGPVIATDTVAGTGGWQKFAVTSADVTTPVTGPHIVFLLFKGTGYLFNLDKFTFGDPSVLSAPDKPPVTVPDSIPPGDVENVQAIRDQGAIRLYWDGPYDIDAQKVELTPVSNGQPIGDAVAVGRGIQTASLSGLADAPNLGIAIHAIDASGNVSAGIVVKMDDLPAFTLAADGKAVEEGGSLEDFMTLRFTALDKAAAISSASITIDGAVFPIPPGKPSVDLDMAGKLGAKSASIAIEDAAGNKRYQTVAFNVVTSVGSMQHLIDRFKRSGELSGALIPQLNGDLDQAARHLERGKKDQALKAMQDFVKHLNNKDLSGSVKDKAKTILNTDADSLINAWK